MVSLFSGQYHICFRAYIYPLFNIALHIVQGHVCGAIYPWPISCFQIAVTLSSPPDLNTVAILRGQLPYIPYVEF